MDHQMLMNRATNLSYDRAHVAGVVSLIAAGALSGFAVLAILLAMILRVPAFTAQTMSYFVSLLAANLLQAVGSMVNARWLAIHAVEPGTLCTFQGAIKQAGNVGTAVWSFVLSIYVFRVMFMRTSAPPVLRHVTLCAGWLAIGLIVAIGPLAIQRKEKGPYFGPSGYWCWITHEYPKEQTFLEYFFEFLSAGLSFILYVLILLRVRGNLAHDSQGWHLRFVPRSQRWFLAISRDWLDSSMMQVAARLVWYPITYSVLLVPVAIARFFQFGGMQIPFGATIFTDTLFNLQGLANAILLISTRRLISDSAAALPSFTAPRKVVDVSSPEAVGITPFILPPFDPEQEAKSVRSGTRAQHRSNGSIGSVDSAASVDSQTPLNGNPARRSLAQMIGVAR